MVRSPPTSLRIVSTAHAKAQSRFLTTTAYKTPAKEQAAGATSCARRAWSIFTNISEHNSKPLTLAPGQDSSSFHCHHRHQPRTVSKKDSHSLERGPPSTTLSPIVHPSQRTSTCGMFRLTVLATNSARKRRPVARR
jgi:hypothetical protein